MPLWRGRAALETVRPLADQDAYDERGAVFDDEMGEIDASPNDVAAGAVSATRVWRIACTGEEFRHYEEFLQRMEQYMQRQWHCAVTGRKGLTYAEALLSEAAARRKVDEFPATHRDDVLSVVHMQRASVSDLCAQLRQRYLDLYLPGEIVTVRLAKRAAVLKARILERIPLEARAAAAAVKAYNDANAKASSTGGNSGGGAGGAGAGGSSGGDKAGKPSGESQRFEYKVDLIGSLADEKVIVVPFDAVTRKPFPTPHQRLRDFIRSSCLRGNKQNSPWIVPDADAKRLGLPLAPRDELERIEHEKNNVVVSLDQLAMPSKAITSKYPIADAELTDAERAGEGPYPAPDPLRLLPRAASDVAPFAGDLLQVAEFVAAFDDVLQLTPFDAHDLVAALAASQQTPLLDELHIQLLATLIDAETTAWSRRTAVERDADDRAGIKSLATTIAPPNDANWFTTVFAVFEWREKRGRCTMTPDLRVALERCRADGYFALDVTAKLTIVAALVDELLDTELLRGEINGAVNVLEEARKEEWRRQHPNAKGKVPDDAELAADAPIINSKTRAAAAAESKKSGNKKKSGKKGEPAPPTAAEIENATQRLRSATLGRDRADRRVFYAEYAAPSKLVVEIAEHDAWLAQVRARAVVRRKASADKRKNESQQIDAGEEFEDEPVEKAAEAATTVEAADTALPPTLSSLSKWAQYVTSDQVDRFLAFLNSKGVCEAALKANVIKYGEQLGEALADTDPDELEPSSAYKNKYAAKLQTKRYPPVQVPKAPRAPAASSAATVSAPQPAVERGGSLRDRRERLKSIRKELTDAQRAELDALTRSDLACAACKSARDDDEILVCDGECKRMYHMYCVKPPLKRVPRGRWLCKDCTGGDARASDESDVVCHKCESGHNERSLLLCDGTCGLAYHINCLEPPLTAIPRGNWYCDRCKADDEFDGKSASTASESDDDDDEDDEDKNDKDDDGSTICIVCDSGKRATQLMLCDGECDNAYHIFCLDPPLRRVPKGDWFCGLCRPSRWRRGAPRREPVNVVVVDDAEDESDDEEADFRGRSARGSNKRKSAPARPTRSSSSAKAGKRKQEESDESESESEVDTKKKKTGKVNESESVLSEPDSADEEKRAAPKSKKKAAPPREEGGGAKEESKAGAQATAKARHIG
jgi:hypothetical protein